MNVAIALIVVVIAYGCGMLHGFLVGLVCAVKARRRRESSDHG